MQETQDTRKGFDLVVTHRDEKTGLIVKQDPYTLRIIAAPDGGRTRLFERPPGSGNLWNLKGEAIGRWVIDAKTKVGSYDAKAEHVTYNPPETEDTKLARTLVEKDTKIAELERELASIQAEKSGKKYDKGS